MLMIMIDLQSSAELSFSAMVDEMVCDENQQ